NGQILVPGIARALLDQGIGDIVFVIVGETATHRRYARQLARRTHAAKVEDAVRIVGHCADMPAAFATADLVAVTALEPPVLGSVVAQAQAMGRPVVTSDVGVLPEHVVAPPRFSEDVRTGWVAMAGDPADFVRALTLALSVDQNAYRGM